MLKRIAAGFGMADSAKFAAFSCEVMAACADHDPETIEAATKSLLRGQRRPHIGDVYAALSDTAEKKSLTTDQRRGLATPSADDEIDLILAWMTGAAARWHDWAAVFGEASPAGETWVPAAKMRDFALQRAARFAGAIDDFVGRARAPAEKGGSAHDRRREFSLRHAMRYGDAAGFEDRLDEFRRSAGGERDQDRYW
jgi:hypothetical protein